MEKSTTKKLNGNLIEKMYLGIPYDTEGFKSWLIASQKLSEDAADKQIDIIREADIELWKPGEPEVFKLLGEWLEEARKAGSDTLRSLYMDFAFTILITHIQDLQELERVARKEDRTFLANVVGAFKWYESFLRSKYNYYEFDPDIYYEEEETKLKNTRYEKIPLDSEFSRYLKDSKYADHVRYKMMSNLRKLNALIINNGRGESDWLQSIVDKARAGVNIRYARLIAPRVVHVAIENIDGSEDITEDALRGGLSTLNHYLDYLIKRFLTKKA